MKKTATVRQAAAEACPIPSGRPTVSTKLQRLVDLLQQPQGATLAELMEVTGWQAHSVRGALAGGLKRKGHAIASVKTDGVRRYRIVAMSGEAAQ